MQKFDLVLPSGRWGCASATSAKGNLRFPVEMAGVPTLTVTNPTSWLVFNNVYTRIATTNVSASALNKLGCEVTVTAPAASYTVGFASVLYTNASNEYMEFEV